MVGTVVAPGTVEEDTVGGAQIPALVGRIERLPLAAARVSVITLTDPGCRALVVSGIGQAVFRTLSVLVRGRPGRP